MREGELRYPRVAAFVYGTPWAMEPTKFAALDAVLRLRLAGGHVSDAEIAAVVGQRRNAAAPRPPRGVAVIPIQGVIAQHGGLLMESSGGTSVDGVSGALRAAVADPEVGGIVLAVDSPGGSVFGIEELAAEIAAANQRKPVLAVADATAASAAYWLASAAGELSVTPSGEVGSIGVLAAHEDVSGLQAQLGVTTSLITAGKYKGEGNPYEPLGAEARAALQDRVDEYYAAFTRAVAKGRHTTVDAVRGGFGEGRMVGAREAVRLGMADRVETLDQAVMRMASLLADGNGRGAQQAVEWLPPLEAVDAGAAGPTRTAAPADDPSEAAGLPVEETADAAARVAAEPQDGVAPTPPSLRRRRLLLRGRAAALR